MMLAVVLTSPTADELLSEHRRFVAEGAKLVEWRLDLQRKPFDVAKLLAQRPGPVIVTVRLPADGGKWTGPENERRRILNDAIAAGAEYVDLEADTASIITRRGSTKRIVSYHNFDETPSDLDAIHARLAAPDADIVKLATMARSAHDAFRMFELVCETRIPTIGLCMGELGTPTRLLAGKFGSPLTYAAPDGREPPAPGQVGYRAMRDVYRCEKIDRDTQLYGVIGDPIAHSKSPTIYNAAFAELGMNAVYVPLRVPSDELSSFLKNARQLGFRGLSVTIPHKEGVLASVTDADDMVRSIGAANTLRFDYGGIQAFNTDCTAAVECLGVPLAGKRTLLLGAGGVAKAIVFGLHQAGAKVVVASRTRERADEVARPWDCQAVDWDARHNVAADIVVNCTPLGMSPRTEESPIDATFLKPAMIVFDTVYTPERTLLIRQAEAAGCTVVTGVEMFVRQAVRQFKLLTGRDAPVDVMRAALRST
jgi:3-dehydroquinate dehydratase/shikimate dehydrogenase